MKVIKRDGNTVDFDRSKIIRAIQKANAAVDPEERISEDQISAIANAVQEKNRPRLLVEDIQDMVEQQLMELDKYTLAKTYIIYRYTRALVRKAEHHRRIHPLPAAQHQQGAGRGKLQQEHRHRLHPARLHRRRGEPRPDPPHPAAREDLQGSRRGRSCTSTTPTTLCSPFSTAASSTSAICWTTAP